MRSKRRFATNPLQKQRRRAVTLSHPFLSYTKSQREGARAVLDQRQQTTFLLATVIRNKPRIHPMLETMMKSSSHPRKHQSIPTNNPRWLFGATSPAKRASMAIGSAHKLTTPKRAAPEHPATAVKPTMRYPLATTMVKPALEWKPFFSCLIDTVAVLIDVEHKSLRKIAQNNPKATLNKPSKISAQTWMTQFFGLLCLSRGPFGQFAGR